MKLNKYKTIKEKAIKEIEKQTVLPNRITAKDIITKIMADIVELRSKGYSLEKIHNLYKEQIKIDTDTDISFSTFKKYINQLKDTTVMTKEEIELLEQFGNKLKRETNGFKSVEEKEKYIKYYNALQKGNKSNTFKEEFKNRFSYILEWNVINNE